MAFKIIVAIIISLALLGLADVVGAVYDVVTAPQRTGVYL